MRSRTEWLERALRGVALGALAVAAWTAGRAVPVGGAAVSIDTLDLSGVAEDSIAPRLAQRFATSASGTSSLQLVLRRVPPPEARALLQAAREAEVPYAWRVAPGATLPPLGLALSTRRDPMGGVVVRAAADSGRSLVLRDRVGWLDSARVEGRGVAWSVSGEVRSACVDADGTQACATTRAQNASSRVRLYATPGWEAQFTMRALEEAGYTVDAQLDVAPRVAVRAGRPVSLDTARYVAVIALDSAAWPDASAIARYVRAGGGLVVGGAAAEGAPGVLPLAATVGPLLPAVPGALRGATPREGVPLQPLVRVAPDAVILERSTRPQQPVALAARRVGAGRVVQAGWHELWAWRMVGDDASLQAHRDWWRTQVARAAGAAVESAPPAAWFGGETAPTADLVVRAGPPAEAAAFARTDAARAPTLPSAWWMVLAGSALVGEWWLRRRRGAR